MDRQRNLISILSLSKNGRPLFRSARSGILPNKIRRNVRALFRQRYSGTAVFQGFEHPRHISANILHNLDPLHILLRFTGLHTVNRIPIKGWNNQRICQIKNSYSSDGKRPPHRNGAVRQQPPPAYKRIVARLRNKKSGPKNFSSSQQFPNNTPEIQ